MNISQVPDSVDSQFVQELSNALINFTPSQGFFILEVCTDNNPDWTVLLQFDDGISLTLETNSSNMLTLGGPLQVKGGEQIYVQYSADFLVALADLIEALGLLFGQPFGTYCSSVVVIDLAYP